MCLVGTFPRNYRISANGAHLGTLSRNVQNKIPVDIQQNYSIKEKKVLSVVIIKFGMNKLDEI